MLYETIARADLMLCLFLLTTAVVFFVDSASERGRAATGCAFVLFALEAAVFACRRRAVARKSRGTLAAVGLASGTLPAFALYLVVASATVDSFLFDSTQCADATVCNEQQRTVCGAEAAPVLLPQ